jgi:phosphate transport system substrate-binding protein
VVSKQHVLVLALAGVLSLGLVACGDDDEASGSGSDAPSGLSGSIRIDGSSTVGPLTEAVAEQFNGENPDVDITVGQSGTGGGFEKFCAGETVMNDASRPIEAEEEKLCQEGGVEYEEVQVANDALTVVVNPNNPVSCVTIDQLAAIWGPDNPAASWGDVEDLDAEFTAELERFGPGTDSGTFDYFTDAVNGEEGVQTKDYNNVGEDDNQTVTGVQGSEGGIGYFGYSYYQENSEGLKALEIENEEGDCVAPSEETVQDGSYNPLGRELYVYPSTEEASNDPTSGFLTYYVDTVNDVAPSIGFIPMTEEQTTAAQDTVAKITGG